jgi:hypothetical protein
VVSALTDRDQDLRGALTRLIAEMGRAPDLRTLAATSALSAAETESSLRRLHDAHALLLHPHACRPWAVHPFALAPGNCWVQTPRRGYWANCLYCAFGIAAALECDAVISTRLGGEAEAVNYAIKDGAPVSTGHLFHLSTPAAHWWDNVMFACASFQPFRHADDIDPWCLRHDLPRGHVFEMPALWAFARDWYGGYLKTPWRKRTINETRVLFARHGLTSAFWRL